MTVKDMVDYLQELLKELAKGPPPKLDQETVENMLIIIEKLREQLREAGISEDDFTT